jgi:hypothetical protein
MANSVAAATTIIPAMLVGAALAVGPITLLPRPAVGQQPSREALLYFENHIRPLFVDRCIKCHGPTKSESGLRLDQLPTMLKGGDTGPAVVPGDPAASLLLKAVRHEEGLEMPPDEVQLTALQIAAIERWIQDGAVWPEGMKLGGGVELRGGPITDQERAFWSLQPIADPAPPDVDPALPDANDIDRFVHARLAEEGLSMRVPADKRTLIRRATFDLTGLPPTPDDVEAFLADDSPDAWKRVVDRLLDSPAYGERWGRHWLDVVRYSDTAGETADYPAPLAYKYRNWVIRAINADMPYDEFVRQQVAGDLLAREMLARQSGSAAEEATARYADMLAATGFIAISRRFGYDVENYHHLTIQDTIDVLGQSVLGLTLGCARCHDHKFDPVNMTDYYAWYGILSSTRYSFPGSEEKHRPYDSFPALPPDAAAARQAEYDQRLAALEAELQKIETEVKAANEQAANEQGANEQGAKEQAPDEKAPDEKAADSPAVPEATTQRLAELTAQRDALKQAGPFSPEELVYGAIEGDQPADVPIQLRGDKLKLGDIAPRRNLEILGGDLVGPDAGSGRQQLADWLTRPTNPLTPRVMVNRIWQQHFGRGLVGTENDFGARGERPTHPELLDWLASRFIESGWSIKQMHRLIMASAAYQQSSEYDDDAAERDPEARLLWRFNRRRLSAEEIRDAMLLASGDLDPTMGGPHPFPPIESWGFTQHAPFYAVYPTNRRSVYLMQQRIKRHPFLSLFDGADPNVSTARREPTTVPTQALYLMNSEFVHDRAQSLAKRLIAESPDVKTRMERIYQIALGRPPSDDDRREASEFLANYAAALADDGVPEDARELAAWSALARTMLVRNEFLFVD